MRRRNRNSHLVEGLNDTEFESAGVVIYQEGKKIYLR